MAECDDTGHVSAASDSSDDIAEFISNFEELNPGGLCGYQNEPEYNSSELDSDSEESHHSSSVKSNDLPLNLVWPYGTTVKKFPDG